MGMRRVSRCASSWAEGKIARGVAPFAPAHQLDLILNCLNEMDKERKRVDLPARRPVV